MYTDKMNGLFESLPLLATKLLQLIRQSVKDKHVQQILSEVSDDTSKGIVMCDLNVRY